MKTVLVIVKETGEKRTMTTKRWSAMTKEEQNLYQRVGVEKGMAMNAMPKKKVNPQQSNAAPVDAKQAEKAAKLKKEAEKKAAEAKKKAEAKAKEEAKKNK